MSTNNGAAGDIAAEQNGVTAADEGGRAEQVPTEDNIEVRLRDWISDLVLCGRESCGCCGLNYDIANGEKYSLPDIIATHAIKCTDSPIFALLANRAALKNKCGLLLAELCGAVGTGTRYYPASECVGRVFNIYSETSDPRNVQAPVGQIELSQAEQIGVDLFIVPMQVYETSCPALLRVVFMLAEGCGSLPHSQALGCTVAEYGENNIRTAMMTRKKKLYYPTNGYDSPAIISPGIIDLSPMLAAKPPEGEAGGYSF